MRGKEREGEVGSNCLSLITADCDDTLQTACTLQKVCMWPTGGGNATFPSVCRSPGLQRY